MAERVTNDFATTLAASISSGATTMTVALPIPSGLSGGNFRARIENADSQGRPTGLNVEFVNVTAVSDTTWTITRAAEDSDRYPAASHAAGSVVTHVLTAGALTSMIGESGSGGHIVQDEGVPLTQRSVLNFTGSGVTASDTAGKTTVTIPGGAPSASAVPVSPTVGGNNNVDSVLRDHETRLVTGSPGATILMGCVVWDGTGDQPERPAGFPSVLWISPVNPEENALDNDLWVSPSAP